MARKKGFIVKVLVVENDPLWADKMEYWFGQLGHTVVGVASNNSQALNLYTKENPQIVTIDGGLDDDCKGLDVAVEIRSSDPNVRIIMVTTLGEQFEGFGVRKSELDLSLLQQILLRQTTKTPRT